MHNDQREAIYQIDAVLRLLEIDMACFPPVEPQPITNSRDYHNGYNVGARRAYMNAIAILSQLRSEVAA